VNIAILWNSLYINAALDQLAGEGYSIRPEDVARLSPLVFEHINLLGRYAFSVPDHVVRGQLRPPSSSPANRPTPWKTSLEVLPGLQNPGDLNPVFSFKSCSNVPGYRFIGPARTFSVTP